MQPMYTYDIISGVFSMLIAKHLLKIKVAVELGFTIPRLQVSIARKWGGLSIWNVGLELT